MRRIISNLVLSSKRGRRQIVSAKIGAVAIATAGMTTFYLLSTFITNFLAVGSMAGMYAPLRNVASFVRSPFDWQVWQFTIISVVWILLVAVVYCLFISFVSAKTSNSLVVFISLISLLLPVAFSVMGTAVSVALKPVIDFGFSPLIQFNGLFAEFEAYNIAGMVVQNYVIAVILLLIVGGLSCAGLYRSQKTRTVA